MENLRDVYGSSFDFDEFLHLHRSNPQMMYPAFRMRGKIVKNVLGERWWSKKRRELGLVGGGEEAEAVELRAAMKRYMSPAYWMRAAKVAALTLATGQLPEDDGDKTDSDDDSLSDIPDGVVQAAEVVAFDESEAVATKARLKTDRAARKETARVREEFKRKLVEQKRKRSLTFTGSEARGPIVIMHDPDWPPKKLYEGGG